MNIIKLIAIAMSIVGWIMGINIPSKEFLVWGLLLGLWALRIFVRGKYGAEASGYVALVMRIIGLVLLAITIKSSLDSHKQLDEYNASLSRALASQRITSDANYNDVLDEDIDNLKKSGIIYKLDQLSDEEINQIVTSYNDYLNSDSNKGGAQYSLNYEIIKWAIQEKGHSCDLIMIIKTTKKNYSDFYKAIVFSDIKRKSEQLSYHLNNDEYEPSDLSSYDNYYSQHMTDISSELGEDLEYSDNFSEEASIIGIVDDLISITIKNSNHNFKMPLSDNARIILSTNGDNDVEISAHMFKSMLSGCGSEWIGDEFVDIPDSANVTVKNGVITEITALGVTVHENEDGEFTLTKPVADYVGDAEIKSVDNSGITIIRGTWNTDGEDGPEFIAESGEETYALNYYGVYNVSDTFYAMDNKANKSNDYYKLCTKNEFIDAVNYSLDEMDVPFIADIEIKDGEVKSAQAYWIP